ncbi:hypothetical protein [Halarchaeum sp. P4]|uniref:hypothetical protein n=1 Tax=Halarchaeum sp. P4 TaxID=3421639 RepID=UPI003EBFFB49
MTSTRRSTRTEHTEETADETPEFDAEYDETPTVNCRAVHSDRRVFTEDGNSDGWIATDLTVTPKE